MKKLITEWRRYLAEGEVKFSGILKAKPDSAIIAEIERRQKNLPEQAVLLANKDLHVTLIHQDFLKPFRERLRTMKFNDAPPVILDTGVIIKTDSSQGTEKMSWAINLVNQNEMRDYVAELMEQLGAEITNPEPERVFHVSIANLTGNPHDSVR